MELSKWIYKMNNERKRERKKDRKKKSIIDAPKERKENKTNKIF